MVTRGKMRYASSLPAVQSERMQVRELAEVVGLSPRQVQAMAARGEIPSAALFGTRWTFNRAQVRRWVAQKKRGAKRDEVGHTVYFIQAESGPIKIGTTRGPAEFRACGLQVGSWGTLNVIATEPGGASRESELHRQFAAHRIRNEWFSPSPDLVAYIGALREAADPK